jgi:hypothetical protein
MKSAGLFWCISQIFRPAFDMFLLIWKEEVCCISHAPGPIEGLDWIDMSLIFTGNTWNAGGMDHMIQPSGGDLLCCISQTETSSDSHFRVLKFDSIFALRDRLSSRPSREAE